MGRKVTVYGYQFKMAYCRQIRNKVDLCRRYSMYITAAFQYQG